MDKIFEQANQGIDQVTCIWAHLPESDFLENIEKVNENDYAVENNPLEFQLKQNYPNPFNSETRIKYQLKGNRDHVSFEIFNLLGEKVTTLVNEDQIQGEYQVSWDGKDNNGNNIASGIYIYKLSAGEFNEVKRMILVR